MKSLALQLLIHHSVASQHCDLRKYSMRSTDNVEKVTCRSCKDILDLPKYKYFYTIHHFDVLIKQCVEEDDLRFYAKKICGFTNKQIDRAIHQSRRATYKGDFVIYRHQRKKLDES